MPPGSTERANGMKNRIKVFRAMHDLTQEALANDLGVTRQTILAIEKGKYRSVPGACLQDSPLFRCKY